MHGPVLAEQGVTATQPRQRWQEPLGERRQHWLAVLVALLLHGALVLVVWQQMRPRVAVPTSTAPVQEVLQIRFISRTPAASPPVPAMPAPPRPAVPVAPREPPRKNAMTLQVPESPPDSTAPLFDKDGEPRLPAASSSAPSVPGYIPHLPQGDAGIMQHRSPVDYQATRFNQDWGKSNAVDSALQKVVDKTTVKKTIRLPGGVRIHCAVSLAMLAGGCGGDPPAAPSAKDGDVRLNMAPARSLDGRDHASKPPSEQACIEMYRAGKPLAWGCPVDTPNRAVDAELREHAAKGPRGH